MMINMWTLFLVPGTSLAIMLNGSPAVGRRGNLNALPGKPWTCTHISEISVKGVRLKK